jgi:hypothetical protein
MKHRLLFFLFAIVLILFIYFFFFYNKEGLDNGEETDSGGTDSGGTDSGGTDSGGAAATGAGAAATGTGAAATGAAATGTGDTGTASAGTTSSNLNKIVDAITAAFTKSPPVANDQARPSYKIYSSDPSKKTVFSQDKCAPKQAAVTELPVDAQVKQLTEKHITTSNSQLDAYEKKLDAILEKLAHPEKLLMLNPNISTISQYGAPIATITYDAELNSLLNITVPKGVNGQVGGTGIIGLIGNQLIGNNGGQGNEGTNPFSNNTTSTMPFWNSVLDNSQG